MGHKQVRWGIALACAIAVALAFAPAKVWAQPTPVTHTLTWWCADLNNVWKVKVPVIGPVAWLVAPDPPCTASPFPVQVPAGSMFAPGNLIWFTNKTYTQEVRAALAEMGYNFHSNSPAEDFMSKLAGIRVEVKTFPGDVLLGEYSFDPRQSFRLVRVRELFFGPFSIGPIANPALGIDLSADEVDRLPLYGFPVMLPAPTAPGQYRIRVWLTMSDRHCDGLGVLDENFLPPGEFQYIAPRFTVP